MCIQFDLSTIDWTAIACFCAIGAPILTRRKDKSDYRKMVDANIIILCNALVNDPCAYEEGSPQHWQTVQYVCGQLQTIIIQAETMNYHNHKYRDLLYYVRKVLQYQTGIGYEQAYQDLRDHCLNNIKGVTENSEFCK